MGLERTVTGRSQFQDFGRTSPGQRNACSAMSVVMDQDRARRPFCFESDLGSGGAKTHPLLKNAHLSEKRLDF